MNFKTSQKLCRLFAATALATAANQALAQTAVTWGPWTFTYNVSGSLDGLSLSNVAFNGRQLVYKISMPVIRVFYADNSCGPYADRLGATLMPIPWANNATLAQREFTLDGKQWYEIGIRAQIGSYDIYQVYYLAADGTLDAHVFSKGLQCVVDHIHYPNWRIDFNLDGSGNNVIERSVNSAWTPEPVEFDKPATAADSHLWRVRNTGSGLVVNVQPGYTGFTIPNFTTVPVTAYDNNSVYGRLYKAAEDIGWEVGPNVTVPFGNGESLASDLVMWYEAYMPHAAADGSALWHSSGVRLVNDLGNAPAPTPQPPPPPPAPAPSTIGEAEPNETIATAQPVTMPVIVNGTMSSRTDNDYFKVTVPAGGSLLASMTPNTTSDYDLRVHDATGRVLGSSERGTSVTDQVQWINPNGVATDVYVHVYFYASTGGNNYLLQITNPSAPTTPAPPAPTPPAPTPPAPTPPAPTPPAPTPPAPTPPAPTPPAPTPPAPTPPAPTPPAPTPPAPTPPAPTPPAPAPSGSISEVEPNNAIATAQAVTRPVTVNATMSGAADNDYYKVTVPARTTITVRMTPNLTSDYDLKLYDVSGRVLGSSERGTAVTDQIAWTNSTAAAVSVYVRVYFYAGGTTNTYTLQIN